MKEKVLIFWFQRDLRLEDNVGLRQALAQGIPVLPIFIFDSSNINKGTLIADRSMDFLLQVLKGLNEELREFGSRLQGFIGDELEVFQLLTKQFEVQAVYTNRDYEPTAIQRLNKLRDYLQFNGIPIFDFKDQVIFDQDEILKKDGSPYTVFGPYSKRWKEKLRNILLTESPTNYSNFYQTAWQEFITLGELGYVKTSVVFEKFEWREDLIQQYGLWRDIPAREAGSKIGVHLRFGTVSIRKAVTIAKELSEVWLNQLIWREFFKQILFHFPYVQHRSFKKRFDTFPWRNNEKEFVSWCSGMTGIPIVDAGMRELNETGFMHNRVRMIVASFLCKHLLIDWRWGEAYFAEKLLDYDLSSNNGNWQWVAGTGCDAAPFFRIFNPILQEKKFDPDSFYVHQWIPKSESITPIVDLQQAAKRALYVYQQFREHN